MGQERIIKISLDKQANFIIGRNGTGKTTFINLINACLSADIEILEKIKFTRTTITLENDQETERPRFSVEKRPNENNFFEYVYIFKDFPESTAETYTLSTLNPSFYFPMETLRRHLPGSQKPLPKPRNNKSEVELALKSIFRKTWLSLQRGSEIYEREDFESGEIEFRSGVDQKLEDVANLLARYFSRLDRRASDLTQDFQKEWFLSFLAKNQRPETILQAKIDLVTERSAIEQIFERFNVPRKMYAENLGRHTELAEQAQKKTKAGSNSEDGMLINDFMNLYDAVRLHSLVEKWEALQEKHEETYRPKKIFVEIASDLLFRKALSVDQSNSIKITSHKDDHIDIGDLSSGEKQLLIFLSETLLQEGSPYLFLADEPELSLHIEWQEELVPSILRINPNAQVIFATHSPDVVGDFNKNIFNMENLID